MRRWALAIHGGAGTIPRTETRVSVARRYRSALEEAVAAGEDILGKGGTALDAVVAAVVVMEDSPLFNAGKGSVYNADEEHELDAAVMDGVSLNAGAVACVQRIRNPVLAARAVMEKTQHVLLAGRGAEEFARRQRLRMVSPRYFDTAARLAALRKSVRRSEPETHGTVGAVALDRAGDLAAATSTGGFTGKMAGRIGDSPIVGAGTYADNRACAVSGTGLGEAFMRSLLAYDVAARMRYLREPLERAAARALAELKRLGASGGLVAVDRHGNIAMPFNSGGMYRACVSSDAKRFIAIRGR